jgi:hypothetical protein
VKEQRICVKLCFKVGKTAAETHMLREAYGDDASSKMTVNGSNILKMEELQWMKMTVMANLQLQDPNL